MYTIVFKCTVGLANYVVFMKKTILKIIIIAFKVNPGFD